MVNHITITKKQARQFLLAYQGLLPAGKFKSKEDIYNFIEKVGCIQFDPLDQVGYNPHLILQARVEDYKPDMLDNLLYKERKLLDGWDKNMSIYPMKDWPYFKRNREKARRKYKKRKELINKIIPKVRKEIKNKGPVSSADLSFDKKIDWSWAPTRAARAALESMFSWGELIVHHKDGTRKTYDYAKRYVPDNLLSQKDPNQSQNEYYRWYVKRRIGSIGMLWTLSGGAWLGIDGLKKKERVRFFTQLVNQEEIKKINVKNIKHSFYILQKDIGLLNQIINGKDFNKEVAFIAPLDNLLWDRKLAKRLFDFEYKWEVYKPASERKFGYYVLPILYGDRLIGRFEPVYDKTKKELIIKNWWWESGVSLTIELKEKLITALKEFLSYLGGDKIQIKEGYANWKEAILKMK